MLGLAGGRPVVGRWSTRLTRAGPGLARGRASERDVGSSPRRATPPRRTRRASRNREASLRGAGVAARAMRSARPVRQRRRQSPASARRAIEASGEDRARRGAMMPSAVLNAAAKVDPQRATAARASVCNMSARRPSATRAAPVNTRGSSATVRHARVVVFPQRDRDLRRPPRSTAGHFGPAGSRMRSARTRARDVGPWERATVVAWFRLTSLMRCRFRRTLASRYSRLDVLRELAEAAG